MDPALLALLPHTVSVAARTGYNTDGSPSFAGAVTVRARVEADARLVRNAAGREVASNHRVYLAPTDVNGQAYTLSLDACITLPAGFTPQAPPVVSVAPQYDMTSLHHYEVRL